MQRQMGPGPDTGDTSFPDLAGRETLYSFSGANLFNRWMFREVAPYCTGDILEIGSGIGNMSRLLLTCPEVHVHLSDLRAEYCATLKNELGDNPALAAIHQLDLTLPDFSKAYGTLSGSFDCVIALNVIEHLEDHKQAIENCRSLLKSGGRLVILVPAFRQLFNSIDRGLGHFRRYDKASLTGILSEAGMKIEKIGYFNAAGIPAWWLAGVFLRDDRIHKREAALFNRLVPLFRLVDRLTARRFGLSVIAVANK